MFDLWLKSVIRWLAVAGVCLFLFCLYTSLNGASAADVVPTPTVTLQQSFAEIIQSATSGVKAGVAFLQQEIPDVVRQLITFNFIYKLVAVVTGILLILAVPIYWLTVVLMAKAYSKKRSLHYWSLDEGCIIGGIIGGIIIGGIGVCFIGANIEDLLKLWLAPKVWLIEYGAALLK